MPTLHFKGKTFVQNYHLAVKYHQLVPKKARSLTDNVSLHDNLILQGDNLKALKALLPTYGGKVKCIYIDPPYNTGNEGWAYNDNVSSPMIKEWLGKAVDMEDLTRHDKWLCMMMPRLKLLHELLAEDGAIFISCDDNEQHHLRVIMDEVFGEDNFVASLVWENKEGGGSSDSKLFRIKHEYITCYAKNFEKVTIKGVDISNAERYKFSDDYESKRGKFYLQKLGMGSIQYSESLDYKIKTPDGTLVSPSDNNNGKRACWRWSKLKFDWGMKNDFIIMKKDYNNIWTVYTKQYLNCDNDGNIIKRQNRPMAVINDFSSTQATKKLQDLFQGRVFEYSKPLDYIKYIINRVSIKNSIILDSFAGSGTTAHAVLDLNKEDGGSRRFILVEQEAYANTITAERVRRVIRGVPASKNFKEGTGGTFSYFELGKPIEMESILTADRLPSYTVFARYVFYTATGEEFDEEVINEKTGFIGESRTYEVYLLYKADLEWLKNHALTLAFCKGLPKFRGRRRLVFAPSKYVDDDTLQHYRIDFCQLPYEIYHLQR